MTTTTSNNPGVVDVSRQAHPPAPSAAATPSGGSLSTSNGENQFPAARTAQARPTSGHGLPLESHPASDGGVRPIATAVARSTSGTGLPSEVHPASCARPVPADVAETTRPPRDVRADAGRPGGLPADVNIR